MANNKIYIPTFISSIDYKPARVLPHIYFYNGTLGSQTYYTEGNSNIIGFGTASLAVTQSVFPYFDNYEGNLPSTGSRSLLFLNEPAVYGETPTESLYSGYWETYVNLLYNPKTRLFDCSAIIPLADYFKLNLNDIVEWRGNYYHLRAITDYNLSNGECNLQLLGPVLSDVISNILPGSCDFNFDITEAPANLVWDLTSCDGVATFFGVKFDTTSSLSPGQVITWGTPLPLGGCYVLSTSESPVDLTGSIVYSIYDNCTDCNPQTGYTITNCATAATLHVSFAGDVPTQPVFTSADLFGGCWTLVGPFTGSLDYTNIVNDGEYENCSACLPSGYYYTGLLCGGSITNSFYSNTDLGDTPGIVYAFSTTAGNTYQCFDNVVRTSTPNTNPIIAVFGDCATCADPGNHCTIQRNDTPFNVVADWYDCQLAEWVFAGTIRPSETRCIGDGSLNIITGGPLTPTIVCTP